MKKPFVKYKPKVENIKEYAKYKQLAYLKKPRSGIHVKFMTDDLDEWMIHKLCYKAKTGEITLNEIVNADSYEYFLQCYLDKGYIKI
jgi:hypothetical protein